jgi:hypothetical protein
VCSRELRGTGIKLAESGDRLLPNGAVVVARDGGSSWKLRLAARTETVTESRTALAAARASIVTTNV